ncbi:MAG: ABC transporter permease, partial [Candidatus Dormibacteraeota bacterium]|nr:ABC transporter permease [Candidatus Dormibacteraeota bacterium]
VTPGQAGIAIGAGLGAGLIGGLVPGLVAARLPVLAALRTAPLQGGRAIRRVLGVAGGGLIAASLGCFLAGGSTAVAAGTACLLAAMVAVMPLVAPLIAGLIARVAAPFAPAASTAAGNLARNRTRTALTAGGVAVSVAVAVAMSALTAGALDASDGWVSHLFVGDTVLTSAVTQRDSVATSIADEPGIGAVSEVRLLSEPVAGSVLGVAAIDPAMFAAHGGIDVISPDRSAALAALQDGPQLLVPEALASQAGWSVGTQLPVQAAKGTVYFTVAGIVAHSFPAGDGSEAVVMDRDLARTYFGAEAAGFDDLLVFSNGSAATVADDAARYGLQAVSVSTIESAARSSLQHAIGLLVAVAAVTVLIAVLAVVNTLAVNVRQGTRELALLRAVGLGRRHALRLVLTESGLLALAAALIGTVAGCLVSLPMLAAAASPGFAPGFTFPLVTALALAAAVALSALVATAGPARRATGTTVLTALRQE